LLQLLQLLQPVLQPQLGAAAQEGAAQLGAAQPQPLLQLLQLLQHLLWQPNKPQPPPHLLQLLQQLLLQPLLQPQLGAAAQVGAAAAHVGAGAAHDGAGAAQLGAAQLGAAAAQPQPLLQLLQQLLPPQRPQCDLQHELEQQLVSQPQPL